MPTGQGNSSTPPTRAGSGREAQRRRTRRALVEATRRLLDAGGPTPTIDAIAAEADVARRTIYTHFPTLDQLLLDAALGALSEAYVDTVLATAESAADHVASLGEDVNARVAALIDALLETSEDTLPLGRQVIRLTVDAAPPAVVGDAAGTSSASTAKRGARRTDWIEAAISPLTPTLTPEQHERLVSGLSLVIGFEAMIVLRDVRGLDRTSEGAVCRWAARALVDAACDEASTPRV